jgi:protein SCO1/2
LTGGEKTVGLAALDPPYILLAFAAAVLLGLISNTATAREEPLPKPLEKVGVTEHLNGKIPLDLPFVDSEGNHVTLGRYFDGRRPVLLTMNYSSCPMLCSLQLNGLFEGLGRLPWNIGDRFQMVTVSIDPLETTERAAQSKQKYLKIYAHPDCSPGWHWLTGRQERIQKLADTVGFGYTFVKESNQFAHPAVVMICTPDGRISRYLYGVQFDVPTLRLALVEAAEGKIGSTLDQVLLYCFHYDSQSGRYAPVAMRVMQVGSLIMALLLGTGLGLFWVRERRKSKHITT